MPVPQSFNTIKLTTSNNSEYDITLQEISGQLYINDHLVITSANIGSLSNITTIESDVTTLQSDVTTIESDVTTLQSDVTAIESDVTTLQSDVTAIESDITTLQSNDTTSIFDNSLTFPDIQVFDTESEFISDITAPQYTIVHAKDTNKLYVWDGNNTWYIYNDTPVFTNTYSLSFDGANDSMDISSTSDFAFGSSGFSISFWFNGGSANNSSGFGVNVFDMRSGNSGSQPSLWIETKGAGSLVKYYASGAYRVSTTATLNSGTWYHLVITNDGSTSKIYLDGNTTPIGTGSDPTTYVAAPLKIGGYFGSNYYYNGLIDEFAIFNSELSGSDISAIYNNGLPTNISSLSPVGWWRMGDNDSGTGTTITDQGSGGNNGTLTNGPTFSTTIPS